MKTIPCEESVLRHNKRNKNIAFPSYPDHYLKETMHPRSKTGLIVAQLDGDLDKQQTDCTHQGHGLQSWAPSRMADSLFAISDAT